MWEGNGASTDDCCMKFDRNIESHCRWHSVDFNRIGMLKAIASIGKSEGLFACRSCSAVFEGRELPELNSEKSSEISKAAQGNRIAVENVRIEGRRGSGYFLRTSISDICEYRNGSIIRLTGKSGWVVLTKKLFLQKTGKAKGRDSVVTYPAITSSNAISRSGITIKEVDPNPVEAEGSEDIFADYDLQRDSARQALSDSSVYLPLMLRDYNAGRTVISKKNDVSGTSVHLSRNVRHRNRGTVDVREVANQRNAGYFSDELYLMNCKSAADRKATCGVGSEGDAQCTCRREKGGRRSLRDGGNISKRLNEAVPVLFEEMKTTEDVEVGKRASGVSLKCVYAETLRDKRTGNKVFWSSDWCEPRNRNKYVFAVSKNGRSRSNREQFSMNEKLRKRKWHRYTTSRKNSESRRAWDGMPEEDAPPGDSPVNPANRCACCKCSPHHVCSGPNEKREEISAFRRLMKDVGLTGINLNFLRKLHCDKPVLRREEDSARYRRKEELRKKVMIDGFREEERNGYSNLKYCDCAKQIEELLNKVELCKPCPQVSQPSPPPVVREDTWEEESEEEEEEFDRSSPPQSKMVSEESDAEVTKAQGAAAADLLNPEVLEDMDKQRRRIAECENMLKKFEIKLEDVRRKNEAFACKCEETAKEKPPVRKEPAPAQQTNVEINTDEITEKEVIKDGHSCCSLPSKIEIVSERKVCTCQICRNIHYIDKQYLPTSWIKKCKGGKTAATEDARKPKIEETPEVAKSEYAESTEETFLYKSDLESETSGKIAECDKNGAISCECTTKDDKTRDKQCCNCDSKLKLIEDRLRVLEKQKKTESTSAKEESSTSHEDVAEASAGEEDEKKGTSAGETDLSSWENLESETDNEVKTKVITCNNMQFFVGGDPNVQGKCQCTEDSYCPFRYIQDDNILATKNVLFVTNIELLRQWSGLYDYKYCDSFWNVKKAALKPAKIRRDWKTVRSAVASFFRRKNYNIFNRRKKKAAVSGNSATASSVSVESFLNDCSRSSMPLKKRSFHVLSEGPHPMRPGRANGNAASKRNRRKSRIMIPER